MNYSTLFYSDLLRLFYVFKRIQVRQNSWANETKEAFKNTRKKLEQISELE